MLLYFTLFLLAGLAHLSEQARYGVFRFRGDILAVGIDSQLYMRRSTSNKYHWFNLPHSCCVTQIHVLPNGAILGVGRNKHLYIRRTLYSTWRLISNSCCVKDVTTFRAKKRSRTYIVGVGINGKLYSKTSLHSKWRGPHRHSGTVSAAAGVTGRIYGVSPWSKYVYRRDGLDCRWTKIKGSCCVKDIYVQDSGRHMTYGVGMNNQLYKTHLNVGVRGRVKWQYQGKQTCCVWSVQLKKRRIAAKIIGAGKIKGQLCYKANLNEPWTYVPKSGYVTNIMVLRDGRLVGVGKNHHLYVKRSIDQRVWHHVPHSCCVKSIAQLKDGRIIGVGLRNNLWLRNKLYGRWIKKIPHSGSVTSITVDRRRGTIIGIGLNKKLYIRKGFGSCSGWGGPLKNSGSLIDVKYGSDGFLYGVGINFRVYKKRTRSMTSAWRLVPRSCCVRSIEVR